MKKSICSELLKFIDKTPNAYSCVENIKNILKSNNFEEIYENETWDNLKEEKNYFVTRNDSSLIAFKTIKTKNNIGFNITESHTDSPSFMIKINPEIYENGYLKLNVCGYGNMINYSWMDRPLSIAGRIVVLYKGKYKKYIINIEKDLLIIPSQAIHINRDVNDGVKLNHQIDMLPILSLENNKIEDIITEYLKKNNKHFDEICDYDLYLYNRDKSKICGLNDEFILAPRLDDLSCLYASLISFIETNNKNSINVFCAFNNEEIGNLSQQGADSTFLIDVLSRINSVFNIKLHEALSNSFAISVDNIHAYHPNALEKNDLINNVIINKGLTIKREITFSTDGLSSSIFKGICKDAKVPYQDFTSRSDLKSGSTLGKISQGHVVIDSIDVGLPQLAMHSSNELIGVKDINYLYYVLLEFYKKTFTKIENRVKR